MVEELINKLDDLAAICRRFGVDRLELVGSATGDSDRPFDPRQSDFDFLVSFGPPPHGMDLLDQYFDLIDIVSDLFERPTQIIDDRAVRNPYLRRSLDRQRRPLVVDGEVVLRATEAA